MNESPQRPSRLLPILLAFFTLTLSACGGWWRQSEKPAPAAGSQPSPTRPAPPRPGETRAIILELEAMIRRNPDDFVAYNKLSAYCLQLQREIGDDELFAKAERAARSSLEVLPAEQNPGGLAALAEVEKATHRFAEARAHAELLIQIQPDKPYPYSLLFDALFELGEYEKAAAALERLRRSAGDDAGVSARRARFALIHGRVEEAREHFTRALALVRAQSTPMGEGVAWHLWQLGETHFSAGDYERAEGLFRDALVAYPDYRAALAALARTRAALGDREGAIQLYEQIINQAPYIEFVAPLGDLYQLAGRRREAAFYYALIERASASAHDNRTLALFYADHGLKSEEAYQRARKEYEKRRDIYTADAVAWTALKAGKVPEAQAAIKEATRLGTKDVRLTYHAGMIARAEGDEAKARQLLSLALSLNPHFDPLQAAAARKALED